MITIVDFEDPEPETFIDYVDKLGDDGEAATFAVAIHRKWAVLTDDKSAINFLFKISPDIKVISTLELIAYWVQQREILEQDVQKVLIHIRDKGHYIPSKTHPMYDWWLQFINLM